MDKKAVLWPVIISVVIHMTLLAVAGMVDFNDNIKPVNVLSVSIQEPEPSQPSKENPAQSNPSSSALKQQKDQGPMMPGAKIPLTWAVPIQNTFIT